MEGKGWKTRSLNLRVLLVAMTLQGITPDAHDLASSRLLRILTVTSADPELTSGVAPAITCSVLHHVSPPGGSAPPVHKHGKKTAGVLCLPVRTGLEQGLRRHSDHPLCLRSAMPYEWITLTRFTPPYRPRGCTTIASGSDLLHSLCRLTC